MTKARVKRQSAGEGQSNGDDSSAGREVWLILNNGQPEPLSRLNRLLGASRKIQLETGV